MQGITKVIKIAVAILAMVVGVSSGVYLVKNTLSDPTPIHEDTATDPKGVYEIYNNTVVTGEQVLTAQITYGNYDAPEPNKGLCRIQTGETRTAYENGTGLEWSDYTQVKNKENPSYVNPLGQFQANLVYGRDLPGTPENVVIIKNYPNELQWIEFRQISTKNVAKPMVLPKDVTPEPTLATEEILKDTPDVITLVASGSMNLWEGTPIENITPKKQGITITYGGVDVTNEVEWLDWNPIITNGKEVQQKTPTIRYKEQTAKVTVNFYRTLSVTVSAENVIDGHPVTVSTNHPTLITNTFSTTDSSVDFRFLVETDDKDPTKLFKHLVDGGLFTTPSSGNYVVANIKQGGANGLATATMTVGVEESRYKATREDSKKINWRIFEVTYFNQTADDAYKNSGNYTDEETGLIAGANDENAGYESLIAQGDVIHLACNAVADVSYEGSSILDKLLGNAVYTKADKSQDYSGSNLERTIVTLKAAKSTDPGKAKVTFVDKVTKFTATTDEKFWTIYSPFSFDIPSINMNTAKKLERDEKYTTTDIIIDGSGSLATSNDKKVYFTKWYSVNDNGVAVHDFTFADFTSADSEDAVETACAVNGQKNNYTLECSTRYDGKNLSTNKQGREHFTAVYVDFGSRYSKEKVVYVWYPLQIEFTRPYDLAWNTDENYSKVSVDEALVATASQNDTLFSWSTSVTDSAKISFGVDNEIKIDDYKTDAPCKVPITNTFSSRSFAFTMTKSGTITPVVTRERTGEVVGVRPIEFVLSTPTELYNLTSADKTRDDVVNTTVAAVNEETNRLACGDKFNYGDGVPVGSISFKVYKGNSSYKKTLQNPEKTLLCECVSDGTSLDVSKSNGIVTVGDDYVSIAKEDSDTFYAIEFTAEGSAYWFVDDPITKFGNTGESTKSYNVYRFEDSYVNNFASGTEQSTGEYKGAWCDSGKKVVLSHQYTTSFNNKKAVNVAMNLASQLVENDHSTDSYKSNKPDDKNEKLTITTSKGSIAGTDTSVTVSHDQFYGRIKTVNWKTFTNLNKEVDVVEMHEKKITLGDGAETYLQLSKLDSDKYVTSKTLDAGATNYNKNTDRLQKVALSGNNLTLVTKPSGDAKITYAVRNKMNGDEYKITVKVYDFVAKICNVFNDNHGYTWDSNSKSSEGKNVIMKDANVLIGDSVAIVANSSEFNVADKEDDPFRDLVSITSLNSEITVGNVTTRKEASVDSVKAYLYANSFFDNDIENQEEFKIKYYSTSSKDGKEPKALITSAGNAVQSVERTMIVTDKDISSYYDGKKVGDKQITNTASDTVKFRSLPYLWVVSTQYFFDKSISDSGCGGAGTDHYHIGSYAFQNSDYPHGATYSAKGLAYTSGAEGATGSAKTNKGITYLNVSELSTSGPSNINGWTGSEGKRYETYKEMSPKSGDPLRCSTGFMRHDVVLDAEGVEPAIDEDLANNKYVYFCVAGWSPANKHQYFTVSYRINGGNWNYINHKGEVTSSLNLKDCTFVWSGSDQDITLHTDKVEGQAETKIPHRTSKNLTSNTVLAVGTYGDLAGKSNVYGGTGECEKDTSCLRINAKGLGWCEDNVEKIDINVTFFYPGELNRSFTIPITYYPTTVEQK